LTYDMEYVGEARLGVASYVAESGDELWSFSYYRDTASHTVYRVDLNFLPNENVSILLRDQEDTLPVNVGGVGKVTFLGLYQNGSVKSSVSFLRSGLWPLGHVVNDQGNLFLSAKSYNADGGEGVDGVIVKLDSNYEVLWSRRLLAEHFSCTGLELQPDQEGGVYFAYSTHGDFPVIFGQLNSAGDLLWYKGYSFYEPKIAIGKDGSLFFLSGRKYLDDGSSLPALVLAKTDSLGNIAGCPQYDVCLTTDTFFFEIEHDVWSQGDGFELSPKNIAFEGAEAFLTPYCGTPTPPTPYFSLPDTICAGDCLSPDSIYNRLAHQVEWYISGPGGLDTTIVDTTFNWCFEEAGTYQIEQGVWLLGCSDFYSRELVALPDDLSPPLGQDTLICDEGSYVLQPQSSRPLREFLWADGSMGSILAVESSGLYTLEASDGYCSVRDTVQIDFIRELLEYAPIEPIGDTVLCPDLLPWEVRPQSAYSEAFILNGDSSTQASVFHLAEAGEYSISTEIEGCLLSETFALEVEPCEVDVYIPNAFSPNGDGLNDWVEPLGKAGKFTGIELSVHDRWGGVLYRTNTPPFRWDGRSASGDALNPGVYLLRFRYYNHRALREEEVVVEVNLVK